MYKELLKYFPKDIANIIINYKLLPREHYKTIYDVTLYMINYKRESCCKCKKLYVNVLIEKCINCNKKYCNNCADKYILYYTITTYSIKENSDVTYRESHKWDGNETFNCCSKNDYCDKCLSEFELDTWIKIEDNYCCN